MDEPSLSFNQAASKIEWSKVLINNLKREVGAFIKAKPYHVAVEPDSQIGSYQFKVGLARQIPPLVTLLMGDICGNLRASLDYAWMGLVRKENPGQASKRTLPIADNRKGLVSTIGNAPIKMAAKEIEILLLDRIKPHRDFANGGNRPLIALNDLANWNKHNLLIATAGVTYVPEIWIGTNHIYGAQVRGGVCSLVTYSGEHGDLTYDGEPTVDILFGRHDFVENEPVVPTLANLAQVASEALKAFCEAFPDPRNPRFGH
jgi:hypothetical protein